MKRCVLKSRPTSRPKDRLIVVSQWMRGLGRGKLWSAATAAAMACRLRVENGAQGQNRTADTRIFNPLLYRLSYLGTPNVGGTGFLGDGSRPVQHPAVNPRRSPFPRGFRGLRGLPGRPEWRSHPSTTGPNRCRRTAWSRRVCTGRWPVCRRWDSQPYPAPASSPAVRDKGRPTTLE